MQSYLARVREEWLELLKDTDDDVHARAEALADMHAQALSDVFYQHMLADPQAEEFLSNEQVETRLKASLAVWLRRVLACKSDEVDALIALQQHVGEIHARIGIPAQLVDMGARVLKKNLIPLIIGEDGREDEKIKLLSFTLCSIDLAMEIMSRISTFGESSALKDDENYRIFSSLENPGEEKERQIGNLLSWEMDVMYKVIVDSALGSTPPVSRSDFGMWFNHKGRYYFSGIAEVGYIAKLIQETDELFFHCRDPARTAKQKHQRSELLLQIKSNTSQINALLKGLFDDAARHEVGMDVLTKLLNRRFLAAIFKREIAHANRSGTPLSALLIDVDKFKEIHDNYGHSVGDEILRMISRVLYDHVRSSDFVFRYGGDEFLIVLTEASQEETLRIAERIRSKASRQSVTTPDGHLVATTISTGAAMFDGHPDYERLIQSADAALYRAKRQGRNRIEMFTTR